MEWDELSADEGLRGAQSVMAKAYHKAEAAEVRRLAIAEGSRAIVVKLEGLQNPKGIGAGAWLRNSGFQALVGREFEVALKRRGCVSFPRLRACPVCLGCGEHVDAYGDHAETCTALFGLATHRILATPVHNYVRDAIYSIARTLGLAWRRQG